MAVNPLRLYQLLNHIREHEHRHQGETVEVWARRTWQQALQEHEAEIEQQQKGNTDE